ncbi:MAG: hypothetical protein HRU70_11785 [Phycisphaeraceae bacterium]|jgi:hypothetical protein|nr:MAG: hypothetical protein HRU70_11785 [Phycisphaeraceae bacterium]
MRSLTVVPAVLLSVCVLGLGGCDQKKETAAKTAQTTTPTPAAAEPDWCAEHGVPESICTRCNSKLIAEFKQKGDWCKEHNLPESQCVACHPELKEKFEAMKPKKDK